MVYHWILRVKIMKQTHMKQGLKLQVHPKSTAQTTNFRTQTYSWRVKLNLYHSKVGLLEFQTQTADFVF